MSDVIPSTSKDTPHWCTACFLFFWAVLTHSSFQFVVAFCFLFSGSVGAWVKCVHNFLHMYAYTDTFIYLLLYIYVIFEYVYAYM